MTRSLVLLGSLCVVGAAFIRREFRRSRLYEALLELDGLRGLGGIRETRKERATPSSKLQARTTPSNWVRNRSHRIRALCSVLSVLGALVFAGSLSLLVIGPALVFGGATGILIDGKLRRRNLEDRRRNIHFFLPIVMERLVMAVQAGHDLLSALQILCDFDDVADRVGHLKAFEQDNTTRDPVSDLLHKILVSVESGFTFEAAVREISKLEDVPALRHALVHLSVAHSEGGELVMPLRELSDSTQLYYQESVEEEIAKLPVKVTLPLLCTFAGLIIFFLTTPVMQVLEMTERALPG